MKSFRSGTSSSRGPAPRLALVAAAVVVVALAAGCTTLGPDHQRPAVALPPSFAEAAPQAAPALAADWWTMFGDAELSRRVVQALAANADIAQAVARVEQAQAELGVAAGALLPNIDASGKGQRGRNLPAAPGRVANSFNATLSTAFEIDLWGRLRRTDEAARAQLLASSYARDTVRLSVAALVVRNWIAVRALDTQAEATQRVLDTRADALQVSRLRLDGGVGSRLDVEQADALRADAALQLRELQRQRALAQSQLALLTADPGLRVPPGPFAAAPPAPPAGLPSSLLDRRPDVQRAEQLLVSATAQVGIARAAMRPTLSMTGALGQQSLELGDLLNSGSRIWSLGFGLALPLFDGGQRAARAEGADARRREAVAAYQGAVSAAFQEVADALTDLAAARDAEAEVDRRAVATAQALRLARARRDAGYSPLIELLDAERSAIAASLDQLRNRQARLNATLALVKALGGGWSADAASAGPSR